MQSAILVAAFLIASGGEPSGKAGKIVLADRGRPTATVVLADAPSQSAWLAALELQYHVQKITGATLPIVRDGQPVAGARILVGDPASTTPRDCRSFG